jgi:hypothetical protein
MAGGSRVRPSGRRRAGELRPSRLRNSSAVEQRRQLGRGVLLHGWEDMCIDPERHLDFRVPESSLDHVRWNTGREHQRCDGMPQPVELDSADPAALINRANSRSPIVLT